ncbi:hypothetical protein NMY3_00584 [Candidatus Nitrosocosmicus oleophilus]|uniref:Uncharacterized protein n=1 Tax=Candidatus Nitrosocosmicus oleophilus TaxID=1353260 RepID=A0A654LTT9_9ARCH|nr:hypothetical protein NMY3_00584 [Candidatus Nitrosocosmicus oleophilus]
MKNIEEINRNIIQQSYNINKLANTIKIDYKAYYFTYMY